MFWFGLDQGVMKRKRYSTLPRTTKVDTHHQTQFGVTTRTPLFWFYSSSGDIVSHLSSIDRMKGLLWWQCITNISRQKYFIFISHRIRIVYRNVNHKPLLRWFFYGLDFSRKYIFKMSCLLLAVLSSVISNL